MPKEPEKKFIVVRQLSDKKEIHRVEVTGKSQGQIEKVMMGMLRNMDTDKYFIDDAS
jgi:hypothetical protein